MSWQARDNLVREKVLCSLRQAANRMSAGSVEKSRRAPDSAVDSIISKVLSLSLSTHSKERERERERERASEVLLTGKAGSQKYRKYS